MNTNIDEYKAVMARKNKIQAQAEAILKRAKLAGIPEKFMRIKGEEFNSFLSKSSYSEDDIKKIMSLTYEHPNNLLNRNFILIDGGLSEVRRKAGFALLFRMIACDKFGRVESCRKVAHKLQVKYDFSRQPFAEELKEQDVLYISECESSSFNDRDDVGTFFDEILEYRQDYDLPTIISFVEPLGPLNIMKDRVYGNYLSELTRNGDVIDDGRVFHVKVRV